MIRIVSIRMKDRTERVKKGKKKEEKKRKEKRGERWMMMFGWRKVSPLALVSRRLERKRDSIEGKGFVLGKSESEGRIRINPPSTDLAGTTLQAGHEY